MTVAAGFVCSDGITLASDTLYSGYERQHGRKFWTLGKGSSLVILGGAGTEAGLKRIRDRVGDSLTREQSPMEALSAIETAIKSTNELLQPRFDERTELLVGIRINGKARIYHNPSGDAGIVPVEVVSHCVGIGGYGLGLYIARSLFRSGMSMRWARIIAAHLIKNAKKYCDGYCGGETHIFELPDVGDPAWIKDQTQIADLESYLGPLEQAMTAVLPDETTNEATLRVRLNLMTAAIDKALRSMVIEVPAGELSLAGHPSQLVLQSGSTTVGFVSAPPTPLITFRPQPTEPEEK